MKSPNAKRSIDWPVVILVVIVLNFVAYYLSELGIGRLLRIWFSS